MYFADFILSRGKFYSTAEWRQKLEEEREEERKKVPWYNNLCKELEQYPIDKAPKIATLGQMACDCNINIFQELKYILLKSQLVDDIELDGLIELMKYNQRTKAFSDKNIKKVFNEVAFNHRNITPKMIQNIDWFHTKGENEEKLMQRLLDI